MTPDRRALRSCVLAMVVVAVLAVPVVTAGGPAGEGRAGGAPAVDPGETTTTTATNESESLDAESMGVPFRAHYVTLPSVLLGLPGLVALVVIVGLWRAD